MWNFLFEVREVHEVLVYRSSVSIYSFRNFSWGIASCENVFFEEKHGTSKIINHPRNSTHVTPMCASTTNDVCIAIKLVARQLQATTWSISLKITLMNWLFECWICLLLQEWNLVISRINILFKWDFFNIKPISHTFGTPMCASTTNDVCIAIKLVARQLQATTWSISLKITLMNWLFECWICLLLQEWNSELIIEMLNSLVISRINILFKWDFFNIKPISHTFGTTSAFRIPVIIHNCIL